MCVWNNAFVGVRTRVVSRWWGDGGKEGGTERPGKKEYRCRV